MQQQQSGQPCAKEAAKVQETANVGQLLPVGEVSARLEDGKDLNDVSTYTEPWKYSRLRNLFSPQSLQTMFQQQEALYPDSSIPDPQQFHTCHDPSSFLGDEESFLIENDNDDDYLLGHSFITDMESVLTRRHLDKSMEKSIVDKLSESSGESKAITISTGQPRNPDSFLRNGPSPVPPAIPFATVGHHRPCVGPEEVSFISNFHQNQSFDISVLVENDSTLQPASQHSIQLNSRSFSIMTMPDNDYNKVQEFEGISGHQLQFPKEAADDTTNSSPPQSFHISSKIIAESAGLDLKVEKNEEESSVCSTAVLDDSKALTISEDAKISQSNQPETSRDSNSQRNLLTRSPSLFASSPVNEIFGSEFKDPLIVFPARSKSASPPRRFLNRNKAGKPLRGVVEADVGRDPMMVRTIQECGPNKVQLYQVSCDRKTSKKVPSLASELDGADYGSVSHLEDDFGLNISIKRLKLSEKSFIAPLEAENDPDQGIIKGKEHNQSLLKIDDHPKDVKDEDGKKSSLSHVLALVNDVCNSYDHSDEHETSENNSTKFSIEERQEQMDKTDSPVKEKLEDISKTLHDYKVKPTGAYEEVTVTEKKQPIIEELGEKSELIEKNIESSAEARIDSKSERAINAFDKSPLKSTVACAIDEVNVSKHISNITLLTEDQTTISHCSSHSFFASFDSDASILGHTSFLRSKKYFNGRRKIHSEMVKQNSNTIQSALLMNNSVDEEYARAAIASPSMEDTSGNFTLHEQTPPDAPANIADNTIADGTRFNALNEAFEELLNLDGEPSVLYREISLLIQKNQSEDEEIDTTNLYDDTLDAKRIVRASLAPDAATLTSINLSKKNIDSLYGLSDICPALSGMTVDGNSIHFLAGTPASLIFLSARNNQLNDATTFAHLPNLHYLDVSYNKLTTLKSLSGLKHLRELNVTGNCIETVEGLDSCDGLVKLIMANNRIRGNIRTLKNLQELEHLDLTGNQLETLCGIDHLQKLAVLKAGDNKISKVCIEHKMPSLVELTLYGNRIYDIDVNNFENLQVLNLDFNPLVSQVFNESNRLVKLKELGLRRQSQEKSQFTLNFRLVHDCTMLAISGIHLTSLSQLNGYFCLEYLDITGCHLRALPYDIGASLPNLRVMDISHNSLTSILPLKKLKRLRQLYLFDNDLKSVSESIAPLVGLKKLQELDLRQNPMTANFYPTASTGSCYLFKKSPRTIDESWGKSVEEFLASLNDAAFVRRLCYKSTVIHKLSSSLKVLDGLLISEKDREVSEQQYQQLKTKFAEHSSMASSYQTTPETVRSHQRIAGAIRRDNFLIFPTSTSSLSSKLSGKSKEALFSVPPFPRHDSADSRRSPLIARDQSTLNNASVPKIVKNFTNLHNKKLNLHERSENLQPTKKPAVSFWIPVEKSTAIDTTSLRTPPRTLSQQYSSTATRIQRRQSYKPVSLHQTTPHVNKTQHQSYKVRRYMVYGSDGKAMLLTRDSDPSSRGVWT